MPDLVTHHYIGQNVLQKLPDEIQEKMDKPSFEAMTAGPDTFFFVSFLKKTINRKNFAFGQMMHTTQTKAFLDDLIEKCKTIPMLFGYVSGFITHYYGDTIIHPYVFHHTGVYDEKNPDTYGYRGLHTKLERAIDSYIIETCYHTKPHHYKIHKQVLKTTQLPIDIKEPIDEVFTKLYQFDNAFHKTNQSLVDQQKFYRFIFDRFGFMNWLLHRLDNGTSSLDMRVLSYYKKKIDDIDILNMNKNEWVHPVDGSKRNESVLELIDLAITQSVKTIEAIYDNLFLDKKTPYQIDDISYLSGLELSQTQTMTHFSHMFDAKKE